MNSGSPWRPSPIAGVWRPASSPPPWVTKRAPGCPSSTRAGVQPATLSPIPRRALRTSPHLPSGPAAPRRQRRRPGGDHERRGESRCRPSCWAAALLGLPRGESHPVLAQTRFPNRSRTLLRRERPFHLLGWQTDDPRRHLLRELRTARTVPLWSNLHLRHHPTFFLTPSYSMSSNGFTDSRLSSHLPWIAVRSR